MLGECKPELLWKELEAVGIRPESVDTNGIVKSEGDPALVEAVIRAHGKALSSEDCVNLQGLLDESKWSAYSDARKAPVRVARQQRFRQESDALFMEALEESTLLFDSKKQVYNVKVDQIKWSQWLESKQSIRAALPYPD